MTDTPTPAIDPQAAPPPKPPSGIVPDPTIYRIVVTALSLSMLLVAGGIIYLSATAPIGPGGTPIHVPMNALIAIGSACVGALAGLLTPTALRK